MFMYLFSYRLTCRLWSLKNSRVNKCFEIFRSLWIGNLFSIEEKGRSAGNSKFGSRVLIAVNPLFYFVRTNVFFELLHVQSNLFGISFKNRWIGRLLFTPGLLIIKQNIMHFPILTLFPGRFNRKCSR